jgi:hypothetical protein
MDTLQTNTPTHKQIAAQLCIRTHNRINI